MARTRRVGRRDGVVAGGAEVASRRIRLDGALAPGASRASGRKE